MNRAFKDLKLSRDEASSLEVCEGTQFFVENGMVCVEGQYVGAFFERAEDVEECKVEWVQHRLCLFQNIPVKS